MSESEFSELDQLKNEAKQLKEILAGVKTAESTPDDARAKIAEYCQSHGASDGFMKADPGSEEKNIYHSSGGGGGGGAWKLLADGIGSGCTDIGAIESVNRFNPVSIRSFIRSESNSKELLSSGSEFI